jgi:hypothetical protein
LSGLSRSNQRFQAAYAADQAETMLKKLLAVWNAGDRFASQQKDALLAFDTVWAWLVSVQGCGNPELGGYGERCISERAASGTVPGTQGNWFSWYRDVIANDTTVRPDPGTDTGAGTYLTDLVSGITPTPSGSAVRAGGGVPATPTTLLLAGAAVVVLVLMMGSRRQ